MVDLNTSLDQTLIDLRPETFHKWIREAGRRTPLMGHQDAAVDKALARLGRDAAAGVVCVPTGGGKTRIGAEVVTTLIRDSGLRVLWLAHKLELVDQAVEALVKVAAGRAITMKVGRFQAAARKVAGRVNVVVASIATVNWGENLARLLRGNPHFDLIVIDECHHSVARTWRQLILELRDIFPSLRLLGLSATPFREDEDEDDALQLLFQRTVLHEVTATELIENRVLAIPRFSEVNTREIMNFAGGISRTDENLEFKAWQLRQIADRQARNQLMVDVYLAHRRRFGPTLIFTCTIKHCEQIAEMLQSAGVMRVSAIHGDTSRIRPKQRRKILDDYRQGRLDVLVSAMLLTEGTDLPKTGTILMARPTRSPILFRQMIGRGLRGPKVGGTSECNIVLFRDTFSDHAADGLAHQLSWLAGLGDLDLAIQKLDEKDLESEKKNAKLQDPLLVAERAKRRATVEESLRALVAEAELVADAQDRRLEGWWELYRGPSIPALVLPCFQGVESVNKLVERLKTAISTMAPTFDWYADDLRFNSAPLNVRAVAFARTAFKARVIPQWVDIAAAEDGKTFEAPRRFDDPHYEETYVAVGRELLRDEVQHLVKKVGRGIQDWSKSNAELWAGRVTSSETWGRLLKRSEAFYSRDEWRDLVKQARIWLEEHRPDDA